MVFGSALPKVFWSGPKLACWATPVKRKCEGTAIAFPSDPTPNNKFPAIWSCDRDFLVVTSHSWTIPFGRGTAKVLPSWRNDTPPNPLNASSNSKTSLVVDASHTLTPYAGLTSPVCPAAPAAARSFPSRENVTATTAKLGAFSTTISLPRRMSQSRTVARRLPVANTSLEGENARVNTLPPAFVASRTTFVPVAAFQIRTVPLDSPAAKSWPSLEYAKL